MRRGSRTAVAWVVAGIVVILAAYHERWFGADAPSLSGPARDVSLAGGGTSDGSRCGDKGYHYFTLGAVTDDPDEALPTSPEGPELALGSYGAGKTGNSPGAFNISFSITPGSDSRSLDLSAPLGPLGVAVEIEGPNGLVGGAHNLPVALDDNSVRLPNGKIRVDGADGLSGDIKMPAEALCPGYDVMAVNRNLQPPVDISKTITGQPPYTLTVSISDPAVTVLRAELSSTAAGPVLAANNFVPR